MVVMSVFLAAATAMTHTSRNPRDDRKNRSWPPVCQQLRKAATNHRTRTRPRTDPPPESEPA